MPAEFNSADVEGQRGTYSEVSSEDPSAQSSANPSRPTSASGDRHPQRRGRVRFNSTSHANDGTNRRSNIPALDDVENLITDIILQKDTRPSPAHSRNGSSSALLRRTPDIEKENPFADSVTGIGSPVLKPRPSLVSRKNPSYEVDQGPESVNEEKTFSALAAQERAQRIASLVGSHSAPSSRRNSVDEDEESIGQLRAGGTRGYPVRVDDIPLIDMDSKRTYDEPGLESDNEEVQSGRPKQSATTEAHKLVRAHTRKERTRGLKVPAEPAPGLVSGQVTPTEEQKYHEEYVARPEQYRGGVLSSLLKLYNNPSAQSGHSRKGSDVSQSPSHSHGGTMPGSGETSGTTTPKTKHQKWYKQQQHKSQSQDTLVGLIEASNMLSSHAAAQGSITPKKTGPVRPGAKRTQSGTFIGSAMNKFSKPRLEDEIRITIHIAETLSRQKYLLKLCRALMSYGAPTHRLEEYMKMSARVLEIDSQFLYIPGCMIVSFDDASTHTTDVKLVRSIQGVDLGKLKDVHEIYKEVVHDVIGVEEASQRLDVIIANKQKNHAWALVFVYGLASASVAPFAFEGRLIDMPIAFLLGSVLGFLQLIVAPRSDLYSNVFEICAAVFTSFLARAFGSIRNGNLFCFSALAQSSIALILPGYMVLCASLELQSKSMVAGSVRMVYAIIYSLFLGFGITVGTAFYGLMDPNATSATTCTNPITGYWKWFFVPAFALCLAIINQAKWKQMPVMVVIAFAGYVVNYFSAMKFPSSAQISNTFGALTVGVLGNLYSRVHHGVAAAALLPAIFVQVPSGLAASGSLLSGLSTADQITNSTSRINGTISGNGTSIVAITSSTDLNTIVFNVGYSMIQVAIGITVGLFLSALIVYPLGKRRSGLFSF